MLFLHPSMQHLTDNAGMSPAPSSVLFNAGEAGIKVLQRLQCLLDIAVSCRDSSDSGTGVGGVDAGLRLVNRMPLNARCE